MIESRTLPTLRCPCREPVDQPPVLDPRLGCRTRALPHKCSPLFVLASVQGAAHNTAVRNLAWAFGD